MYTAAVVDARRATHLDAPRTWHRGHAAAARTSRADRRRRDWVDRKQKSKSFDFCWQSGLWSPIDRPAADIVVGGGGQTSPPPPPPLLSVPPLTAAVPVAVPAAAPPAAAERETDECRRTSPRLKLPPMFHMDSGSSFESYEPGDGLLQHQLLKVAVAGIAHYHHLLLSLADL